MFVLFTFCSIIIISRFTNKIVHLMLCRVIFCFLNDFHNLMYVFLSKMASFVDRDWLFNFFNFTTPLHDTVVNNLFYSFIFPFVPWRESMFGVTLINCMIQFMTESTLLTIILVSISSSTLRFPSSIMLCFPVSFTT